MFTSGRSIPSLLASDTFQSFKLNNVNDFFHKPEIFWNFVVEGWLRWDGFYEWLISIVKSFLKKELSKIYLTYLEVRIALAEIESFMNSRPLNEDQFWESLTRNSLI